MRKLLAIVLIVFVGYYVMSKPDDAAQTTRDVVEIGKQGGDSGVTFLNELTRGGAVDDGGAKG